MTAEKLEKVKVTRIIDLIWKLRIWTDNPGQDLIEYPPTAKSQ